MLQQMLATFSWKVLLKEGKPRHTPVLVVDTKDTTFYCLLLRLASRTRCTTTAPSHRCYRNLTRPPSASFSSDCVRFSCH